VTEKQWLRCGDPGDLELHLDERGPISDRKIRLFGCGCVRTVWADLPNDILRRSILASERYADGEATAAELRKARGAANGTFEGLGDIIEDHSAIVVTALCEPTASFPMGSGSSAGLAAVAAELASDRGKSWDAGWKRANKQYANLFRCVFGNPFRPVAFDPAWLTETVHSLATGIYAERAFDRMPILADALEEAGCDNADVLNHCRGDGPHVRGCWVVDLLLGKE
jgi:hypothetical protein